MLDLLFIIFDSANLSLAFDTLYDVRWSCISTNTEGLDLVSNVCNELYEPRTTTFNPRKGNGNCDLNL